MIPAAKLIVGRRRRWNGVAGLVAVVSATVFVLITYKLSVFIAVAIANQSIAAKRV